METGTSRIRGILAVLLLLGAAAPALPAAAQQPEMQAARTIRVTGTGEVQARPDQAHIDLAVETSAATAREAGEENARTMERVIRALVAAGVPRGEIETRNYSLYPEYVPPEGPREEQPRIRGYRASNMVSVRTQDLARVGPLIDAALRGGANRMDAVRFSLRDADAAQAEATRRAVTRARQSAENIASALGVRLGQVVDASTTMEMVRPMPYMMRERAAADVASAPTPIEPGEQTIAATVLVVFAIDGGR
ncbi:SIMPL domain-containing protein [soil metagenome]